MEHHNQSINKNYMQIALEEAEYAAKRNEVPVGAVIVYNKKILARNGNRNIEMNDPTAHAEILVIRSACNIIHSQRLIDCELYVTLEPCTMCASAISFARITRLYYGAKANYKHYTNKGIRFLYQSIVNHIPDVYDCIGESQSRSILENFFKKRR